MWVFPAWRPSAPGALSAAAGRPGKAPENKHANRRHEEPGSEHLHEVPFHCLRIFPICNVSGLHFTDLKVEDVGIEMQGSPVILPDMQGDIVGHEDLYHGSRSLVHQLLNQAKTQVGMLHSQRGDMSVG